MQNYAYTARDEYGKAVHAAMTAEDEIDLANKISNLGYFLVRAKIVTGPSEVSVKINPLKPRQVLNFTIYLATLLNAGVPLIDALWDLAQDAERTNIKRVIDDIRCRIESGSTLEQALSFHRRSFSKLYTAIVSAGESTGKLVVCLNDLVNLLDWQLELKAKMKEAATYPLILLSVMVGVVTLLVVKVIPTFEPVFKGTGVALPLPTQIVLGVSHFVRSFWYIVTGFLILSVIGYRLYNSTANGRYKLDSLKLRLPLFGQLLCKVALSRFCHTLAISLSSGVDVLTALDFGGEVVNNLRLERAIAKVRDAVNVGEKLGDALRVCGEFPPLVVRMITVGEQSGALTQTLNKVNQFYDREVPLTVKKMFALFEPIMIVVMGVVVGLITFSIFLPMFQMVQLIGG